jgi:hypothetical protein
MKRLHAGLLLLVFLLSISYAPAAQAQTSAIATKAAEPLSYDVSQEVTLSGTVSSALTKPAAAMIIGSHHLFVTSSGSVDASLGKFALLGDDALAVTAGQQVEVTGVAKMIKDSPVFLTRIVKVGGTVYVIRSKHGFVHLCRFKSPSLGTPGHKFRDWPW